MTPVLVDPRLTPEQAYHRERASYCCRATLILPGSLIKNQNSANQYRWRHEHCTQKERPALEGRGLIDENGGAPECISGENGGDPP